MTSQPRIEQRDAQVYLAARVSVTVDGLAEVVDRSWADVFWRLRERALTCTGPPFIRYLVVDRRGELEIDLAVPVDAGTSGDARLRCDVLPAGRYVTLRYGGPFNGLNRAHASLQRWAHARGVLLDRRDTDRGEEWRSCAEHYLAGLPAGPGPVRWEVELAYLALS